MPRGPKPLKTKLKKNEFYCVKCRSRVKEHEEDICVKKIKNRKIGSVPALKSYCHKCGTSLTRFIKRSAEKDAKRCYGR